MKTLLLFAALCVATYAADETPYKVTFRTPCADDPMSWPTATITWDHPNTDKSDPYKFNQPTKESVYTLKMDEGFKLMVEGHVLITKQEAADVVKAMEILDAPVDFEEARVERESIYARVLRIERNMKSYRKRADDIAWARSILESWKKKLESAK